MKFTRRDRRLSLALALIGAAIPLVGFAVDGSLPSPRLWFPLLVLGVFGAQFGRPWRRPVSNKDIDEYRKWRSETELKAEGEAPAVHQTIPKDQESGPTPPDWNKLAEQRPDMPGYTPGKRASGAFLRWLGPSWLGLAAAGVFFDWLAFAAIRGQVGIGSVIAIVPGLFFSYCAIAVAYLVCTGKKPPGSGGMNHFFGRLGDLLNFRIFNRR